MCLADPDASPHPDEAEERFGIALLHPHTAVGDGVPDGRRIRRAVDADARNRETHPARTEWVFGTGRDRIQMLRPARIGRIPPGMAILADDPKPTAGRRRPHTSRRDREDAERSSALVEVEPVRLASDEHEASHRPSPAGLCRRQASRPGSLLTIERCERRRAHDSIGPEGRVALKAADRRDARRSVPPIQRPRGESVRAEQELCLGDVPASIARRDRAHAEAMATVAAERGAGDRPGNPVDNQPVPALEHADGGNRAGADDPVDRAGVQAPTLQRDLQRGDSGTRCAGACRSEHERRDRGHAEHACAGGASPPASRCRVAHLSVESDRSIDVSSRAFSSAGTSFMVK